MKQLEIQLITSVLYQPDRFSDAAAVVAPADFDNTDCRRTWEAMAELYKQDRLDIVSLGESLGDLNLIQFLTPEHVAGNVSGQARHIKELSAKRTMAAGLDRAGKLAASGESLQDIKDAVGELAKIDGPVSGDGIIKATELYGEVKALYENPREEVFDIGIPAINSNYKLKRGEICLVSGIPNMGKSEFLDWLLVCIAMQHDWKFAYFSPENFPFKHHIRKLIEKKTGLTFLEHGKTKRISIDEIAGAMNWIDEHFMWVHPRESEITVDNILGKFRYLSNTQKIDGVVIDPWNQLGHQRPKELSETEYINKSLARIQRFAKEYNVMVWLVVHPHMLKKNDKGEYDPPSPYELMGSAHWRNMMDNIFCVHRKMTPLADGTSDKGVMIYFQKIRDQRNVGKLGEVELQFDFETGRYE